MHLAADPQLAALATASGHAVVPMLEAHLHPLDAVLVTGPDGWERARTWRAEGVALTVVVHTEGDAPADRAELEPVVLLRNATPSALATALGRCGDRRSAATELAGGRFEPRQRRFCSASGAELPLTPLETRLLAYLASRAGRAVDRQELQEEVWDHRTALDTKAVEVAVARLRRKIEPDLAVPVTLLTVRGGYQVALAETSRGRPSDLIGREAVVAELVRRMSAPATLLALTGPPGVGKSRTAAEVGRSLRASGLAVSSVDLDQVPAQVDPGVALATALDLEVPSSGDALQAVLERLGRGVLLLDHGEQREVLVLQVLRAAQGRCSVLIATQVAPAGAQLVVLAPLDEEAGAQLLMARAGAELGRESARRLVPLLDGLPLALTLAGAQIAMLGLQEFERAVGLRLALLSPPEGGRHGSLREAMTDAVDRLSVPLREALHALVALQGPFGSAECEALLGPEGTLWMAELAARGVIAREGQRMRMLHAVRDHLRDRLGPVRPEVARRHVDWAVAQVSRWMPRLASSGARAAFAELASLHADLRVAAERPQATPQARAALVEALDALLFVTGTELERQALLDRFEPLVAGHRVAEARLARLRAGLYVVRDQQRAERLMRQAAATLADEEPELAARAAMSAAWLICRHDPAAALELLLVVQPARLGRPNQLAVQAMTSIVRLYVGEQALTDTVGELSVLMDELASLDELDEAVFVGTTMVTMLRNVYPERCLPVLQQLVEWSELLRTPTTTAHVQGVLATELGLAGRLEEAHRTLEEADRLLARVQPAVRGRLLLRRAWLDLQSGDTAAARAGYETGLARARLQDEPGIAAETLIHMVLVECDAGRPAAALARAREADELCDRIGRPDLVAHAALSLGLALLLGGDIAGARAALQRSDRAHLAPQSQLSWLSTAIVAGTLLGDDTSTLDAELDERLAEGAPAEAGRIVAEARAGRRPESRGAVDLRLLARVWSALPSR
jgi:DNA-binding response OmpR family regulator/tetratricopeptide (TPR) repeat protein